MGDRKAARVLGRQVAVGVRVRRVSLLFYALVALALLVGSEGVPATKAAPAADFDLPDGSGHFYRQANGQGGAGETGYAITDAGGVSFWSEYRRLGGPDVLGYPVSRRFVWDGFTVQAMQKVVLQWRPDTKSVAFVNVLDRLHDLGSDPWLQAYRQIPPPADTTPDAGLTFAQVARRHLALLDQNAAIKARYNADPDPLAHFGLPMGAADEGTSFVIRAQRAAFQYWKTDVPWAKQGDVTLVNAGNLAKEAGAIPAPAAAPELPPEATQPLPVACPSVPIRGFGLVWSGHPEVYDLLGCPGYPSQELATDVVVQRFEHGWMLRVRRPLPSYGTPVNQIYALFEDNQTYAAFPDTWVAGSDPVSSGLTPPAGLLEPQYGFGKVWREGTGVRTRDRLGWAVSPQAAETGAWQAFQRGVMVWTPDPKQIYVLAERTPHGDLIETWRLYPDLFTG